MKKLHTQRARALLQIGGVVVLLALLAVARNYTFTRDAAVARMEDRVGLEETQVLKDLGRLPRLTRTEFYLAASKHAVGLYGLEFELWDGWDWTADAWTDCSGEGPLYGGAIRYKPYRSEPDQFWFYGRVDDPAAASVTVRAVDPETGGPMGETYTTRRADWITKGGKYYYAFCVDTDDQPVPVSLLDVTAYDGGGRELSRVRVRSEERYLPD